MTPSRTRSAVGYPLLSRSFVGEVDIRKQLQQQDLKPLEGEYYSDELHVLYTVSVKDGKPVLSYSRGEVPLAHFDTDSFVGPWPFGLVKFACSAAKGMHRFHSERKPRQRSAIHQSDALDYKPRIVSMNTSLNFGKV